MEKRNPPQGAPHQTKLARKRVAPTSINPALRSREACGKKKRATKAASAPVDIAQKKVSGVALFLPPRDRQGMYHRRGRWGVPKKKKEISGRISIHVIDTCRSQNGGKKKRLKFGRKSTRT